LSLVSVAAFLVLLIVLYFLEPEFNPPHLISEYELGRFGFLMSLAFFCLGAGSLFLARALWIDLRTKGDRFGGGWLILAGIAYIGAGHFCSRSDIDRREPPAWPIRAYRDLQLADRFHLTEQKLDSR
jgi:hypothetical protein